MRRSNGRRVRSDGRAERDAAIAERDQVMSRLDHLRHFLRQLQRAQFGQRSETLDPGQLALAFEGIEQTIAGNLMRGRCTAQLRTAAIRSLPTLAT